MGEGERGREGERDGERNRDIWTETMPIASINASRERKSFQKIIKKQGNPRDRQRERERERDY